MLVVTSLGLAASNRSWCGLLAGAAALVMHTGYAAGFILGLILRPPPRTPAMAEPENK